MMALWQWKKTKKTQRTTRPAKPNKSLQTKELLNYKTDDYSMYITLFQMSIDWAYTICL